MFRSVLLLILNVTSCASLTTPLTFPRSFLIPNDKLPALFIPAPPATAPYTFVELTSRSLLSPTRSLPLPPAPKAPSPDFGMYDNLPPSIFTPDKPKTLFFNELSKRKKTFQSALESVTGYRVVSAIVEPLSITGRSVALAGAVVIISEANSRCYFVETHLEEALQISCDESLPLYVESDFWETLPNTPRTTRPASSSTPEDFDVPVDLPNPATMGAEEVRSEIFQPPFESC